tara:strand:- start:552 stop:938 length:387 start_codon:yes stop_codon:yes gene_type:complete
MLAMHFYQDITERAQKTYAGWLVIDMGAAAAILTEAAAQDQGFTRLDHQACLLEHSPGRMARCEIEFSGSGSFIGASADQPAFGPLAGGQAESAQQDGLASAGFARQGTQTPVKAGIKTVDEYNIPDR